VSRSAGDASAAAREFLVQNPNRYPEVDRPRLSRWLAALLEEVAPGATSFTARFVGRRAIADLNRGFRGKEGATDVLSFPGGASPEGRHLGDVVVCVPVARRQAPGGEVGPELRRLVLHGVLHCLGHDHETDNGEMSRLERRLRRRWIARHV
jgi:probable rRNA maturation factor